MANSEIIHLLVDESGGKRYPMTSDISVHPLASDYQSAETCVKVIRPENAEDGRTKTLFLLPVDPGDGSAWGDPLPEILKHDLHNKHSLLCVMPTFSAMPWYANHPTDRRSRQESYFVEHVVPIVDEVCPKHAGSDRLLLGFSKSGFGAFNMLLRHPGMFAKAAAWDAPLGMASFSRYGAAETFGTQRNFEEYSVWNALEQNADSVRDRVRLGLFGYETFRGHTQAAHYQMLKWGIPHHYVDGPRRQHRWDSGWLPEVVEFLADGGDD